MDTDNNTDKKVPSTTPTPADNTILTDSGVQIVDGAHSTDEKEESTTPRPQPETTTAPEQKAPSSADDSVTTLEDTFKKELGVTSSSNTTPTTGDDIEKRLHSLKEKIEGKKSGEKGVLEQQLKEFKELKEKIERGLAHVKELSALEAKIAEEEEKLDKAEVLEQEVVNDVSTIEKEVDGV